jgi:general secretion pathway protein D
MGREPASAAIARLVHSSVRLLCALLLVACLGGPATAATAAAAAQLRPQPVPVALTNVRLISESADESRFELTFDPKVTSFAPIAGQPTQPSIGFALASRGPHAVQPSGLKGLVRNISFEQADTVLIMRFGVTQAATISGVQTSDRTIEIMVGTGKAQKGATADYAVPAGGLQAGYEPPPGEEGYELVLLKYADVSDVVGLLTDGLTVK